MSEPRLTMAPGDPQWYNSVNSSSAKARRGYISRWVVAAPVEDTSGQYTSFSLYDNVSLTIKENVHSKMTS